MRKILKALILSIITIALLIILSIPYGQIPPPGKFFDPIIGFWRVAGQDEVAQYPDCSIAGLENKVALIFDKRGVPHIFGESELDVFTAIGYVHARDRLWQMDIQYRFPAGRLAEVFGKQILATDIEQRKLGLLLTAQRIASSLNTNRIEYKILTAYTSGVNHFINQLSYGNYPFEFKLLNYAPESWTIEKTVMVNVMMGYLSRTMDDFHFSRLQQIFSQQELEELFPAFSPSTCPIIPENEPGKLSKDSTEAEQSLSHTSSFNGHPHEYRFGDKISLDREGFGSNNWVVAGSKTTTGKPILANDPHLSLELPSVWYEAQLNCPEFDVYGVTLPGAPFVIIGFNRHIAWGMTNCGWDVTDFYRETFDNERHDRYLYNGSWQPVQKIPQVIQIKDAPDTTIILEYTHRGPIIAQNNEFFSMQWTGNQSNFDGIAVYWLNKAKNYDDYRNALKSYGCPAQNFIYADITGNIAMTCAGKNPVRKHGLGRSIADGANDRAEWISYTPFNQLPSSLNPKQGYLASANQQPINQPQPYFGWNWPTGYRARRINALLKKHDRLDPKDMMKYQTDAYAIRAEVFVPFILQAGGQQADSLKNGVIDSMLYYLENWDYEHRKDEVGATIFDLFMVNFEKRSWLDHFSEGRFFLPRESYLQHLTANAPLSRWFDDIKTPAQENRDDIIRSSLLETKDQLIKEFGAVVSNWKWERYHQTRIPHLSRLKPLGVDPFPNNGGFGTLNVGYGRINSFGPSWRMIVSLEQPIRAWGVYPGGQSGNPASKHYIDFLETWKNEQYFELLLPEKASDLSTDVIESRIFISPKLDKSEPTRKK